MADFSSEQATQQIRALFPAFGEKSLNEMAFFENAGGSYMCSCSLELLENYLRKTRVQPYGAFAASIAGGKAMDRSFRRIAQALNIESDWIHFGPSTSMNTYVLSHAFAPLLRAGDAIIVTNQDHEANSGVWRRLAGQGVEIREWQADPESGHLDPNDLASLLDERTRLVAFPHVSNIVGEINPATGICRMIRAAGALSIVDGVSYCPHGLPDLGHINPDIYLFSAYKTFGPHIGVMAIRPSLAASLPNQGHYFNDHKPRYRLTPAGPDHAQIAAMAGIADYLERISDMLDQTGTGKSSRTGNDADNANDASNDDEHFRRAHDAIRTRETALMQPLLDWIGSRPEMRLIGPQTPSQRMPTLALDLKTPGPELARRLARHGIMAGGGHFYAHRLLERLGIDPEHGVLRLSFVHYTSHNDITRLINALNRELGA